MRVTYKGQFLLDFTLQTIFKNKVSCLDGRLVSSPKTLSGA